MKRLARHSSDLLAIAGLAATLYGIHFYSRPLCWIIGGALVMALGILLSSAERRRQIQERQR